MSVHQLAEASPQLLKLLLLFFHSLKILKIFNKILFTMLLILIYYLNSE